MFRFFFAKLNNITEYLFQGKTFANEANVTIFFALPFQPHQRYEAFVVKPFMPTANVELSNPVFLCVNIFFTGVSLIL